MSSTASHPSSSPRTVESLLKETDPYLVLGVDRNADDQEVTKAFRKTMRRFHPDLAAASEREAYEQAAKKVNWALDAIKHPSTAKSFSVDDNVPRPSTPPKPKEPYTPRPRRPKEDEEQPRSGGPRQPPRQTEGQEPPPSQRRKERTPPRPQPDPTYGTPRRKPEYDPRPPNAPEPEPGSKVEGHAPGMFSPDFEHATRPTRKPRQKRQSYRMARVDLDPGWMLIPAVLFAGVGYVVHVVRHQGYLSDFEDLTDILTTSGTLVYVGALCVLSLAFSRVLKQGWANMGHHTTLMVYGYLFGVLSVPEVFVTFPFPATALAVLLCLYGYLAYQVRLWRLVRREKARTGSR